MKSEYELRTFYIFIFILSTVCFFTSAENYKQFVVDRNKQMPVSLNNYYFLSHCEVIPEENKKQTLSDLSFSIGRIFTYKGLASTNHDFQSLVLIKLLKYDSKTKEFSEFSEFNYALPEVKNQFYTLWACMSKVAAAPSFDLDQNDICPSEFAVNREEVDKFKLQYNEEITKFLEAKRTSVIKKNDSLNSSQSAIFKSVSKLQLGGSRK